MFNPLTISVVPLKQHPNISSNIFLGVLKLFEVQQYISKNRKMKLLKLLEVIETFITMIAYPS